MGKDPAFLFYPNDWLGGTMGMTFEEKGAYMDLLMMQFNRGHMTTDMIGHMLGHTFGLIWEKLQCKFVIDENGLYYNARLELEIKKRQEYCVSRIKNKEGVNQYSNRDRSYDHTHDHHMTTHMSGHMENENVNENITDTDSENKGIGVQGKGELREKIPYQKIVDSWNNNVTNLPQIKVISDNRKRAIKNIWGFDGCNDLSVFDGVFQNVQKSDFLCGRTDKPWTGCGFDWVMKPANWAKIVEGNYANKGNRQMTEAERIMSL